MRLTPEVRTCPSTLNSAHPSSSRSNHRLVKQSSFFIYPLLNDTAPERTERARVGLAG